MSGNKRKRSDDEGQSKYENLQKQKRRKSIGHKAITDLDGKFSATKSQEDSKNNHGVPQADVTGLASEVQRAKDRQSSKKKARKKDSSPALDDNEANTGIQVEGKMDNGVAIPDDKVPKVAPEESEVQATKSRRRRNKKSRNEDPNSALEANEPSTSIQAEVKTGDGVFIATNGEVAKVTPEEREIIKQRRKEKRRKAKEERESRGETAPTWRVSESTGGCMLRIDPLFSPGEE